MKCLFVRERVLRVLPMAALMILGAPIASLGAPFKADRDWFFERCAVLKNYEISTEGKSVVYRGSKPLSASMKKGLHHLFDSWEKFGDADPRRLAFVLATARRESMDSFEPIREAPRCGTDDLCRQKAIGKLLADRAAKYTRPVSDNYAMPDSSGQRFYGRGFVQITLRDNYRKAGAKLGLDLVSNPDQMLDADIAGQVLVRGMLEGWFGNRKPLSTYIDGEKADWINARNNVNPRSPNKPITAAYAKDINACLRPTGTAL